jgi:hypothetical protein
MAIKNALKQLTPKPKEDEGEVVEETESFDRQEIVDLISIRQYVVNATANPAIDRATVNYMNGLLLMIDRKITGLLQSDEFKDYIDYKDVRKAIEEVASINNIKSGLQRNPRTGQLEKIPK